MRNGKGGKDRVVTLASELIVPIQRHLETMRNNQRNNTRLPKEFKMLEYFTLILVCQLIGEFAVTTMDVPFPGPVVWMMLLFVFLSLKGTVPEQLGQVSSALLNNLSLLFVLNSLSIRVYASG